MVRQGKGNENPSKPAFHVRVSLPEGEQQNKQKMDRVTVEDIKKIEPGTSMSWTLPPNKCLSAKNLAYECSFRRVNPRVMKYKVSLNRKESKITITAIPLKTE